MAGIAPYGITKRAGQAQFYTQSCIERKGTRRVVLPVLAQPCNKHNSFWEWGNEKQYRPGLLQNKPHQ